MGGCCGGVGGAGHPLPAPTSAPARRGAGGAGREGLRRGGGCHSRTHAGGMQTAGLPCGHVSAPPTEVGAQVPSLWALGARQAADERRCILTLSWPHPLAAASCRVVVNHEGQRGGGWGGGWVQPLAAEWAALASRRWRGEAYRLPPPPPLPPRAPPASLGSRAQVSQKQMRTPPPQRVSAARANLPGCCALSWKIPVAREPWTESPGVHAAHAAERLRGSTQLLDSGKVGPKSGCLPWVELRGR